MSAPSGRGAAFLEEMGVGPLWRLRRGAPPASAADVSGLADDARPQPVIPAPQPTSPPPVAPPRSAAAPQPVAAPQLVAAPRPVATRPPTPAASEAAPESSTAWFDDAPPPTPVSGQAIAAMDWDELKATAARCTRCELCRTRTSVVFGRGDRDAGWLIVGGAPSRIDEKEGRAVAGEAGQLLDNMLRAIGVGPERDVYVTNLVKCRAPDAAARGPTPEQLAACRPYLERELALTRARTIVTLGQPAAAGLLGPRDAARGAVRRLGASAVVATYHPDDLLRRGAGKAGAWADLCLARGAHGADS